MPMSFKMESKFVISRASICNDRSFRGRNIRESGVLIVLVQLTVQIVCLSAASVDDLSPDVLLESLTPEELENLFDNVLMDMETQLIDIYERHLQNYHASVEELERLRRSRREATNSSQQLASFHENFWHSGIAEIKLDNREILKIESVTVDHILGDVQLEKVFPLNLWQLPSVFLSDNGEAMILKDKKIAHLWVRNKYTKSLKGCLCADSVSLECACCVPEACLCKEVGGYFGNVCLPCGKETDETACAAESPHVLKTQAVVGFEYSLDVFDPVEGLQRIIISSNGSTLSFYKYDDDGLRPVEFENGMTTMSFAKPITHLGFGETYTDLHGSIQRRRFLVTFGAGESHHQFHGLDVASQKLKSGLSQMWQGSGQDMKVWNSGGRIMVGVLSGKDLLIHEMKENQLHEYHLMYTQTISCDNKVSSWKSFSMNFEDYIMLVSPSHARFYHQNGIYYRYMQDLDLTDGISTFKDICYFSIPSCRDKVVFMAGEGKILSAYVWNGTAQHIQKAYTTTLNVAIRNWSVVHAHTEATGFGPLQVVASGTIGPISLDINATLEELPDPVVLQTRALHKRIQDLEDEYQRQNVIIEKFLDRVNNSVDGKAVITGPITVLQGISVEGRLDTGKLESSKVLLHPVTTDDKNITIDYLEHLGEHKELDAVMEDLDGKMNYSFHALQDAVLKDDDKAQLIKGKKTVVGEFSTDTVTVNKLSYGKAKDGLDQYIQLDKILADIIRYNDTRQISGQKTFTKPLQTDNLIAEVLDDIPVKDIVRTTEKEIIVAGATFSKLKVQTIFLSAGATIGVLNVSLLPTINENLSLGHCEFLANLAANDVLTKSDFLSGVDLKHLNISSLKTKGGTIIGPIEFLGDLKVQRTEAKYLMGIDTGEFMANTVFTDQPAEIEGTITVPELEVKNGLLIFGNINGKKFPDSYAILSEGLIRFGSKNFEHLKVDFVKMGLGAKVDSMFTKDIVTLDTDQHISGEKHFMGGITILGNLDIKSKIIDGVNLDVLNATIHDPKFTKNKKFDAIFRGNLSVPAITFNGTLNDLNFTDLAKDIVYDDESPIIIESTKTFGSGLSVANGFWENSFNGQDFKKLVTLNKEHNVTGEKKFQKVVSFTNITVSGLVDSVNLKLLENSVLYSDRAGQIITGKKTFADSIVAQEFQVNGKVNGVDFQRVATRHGNQTFTAPQTIQSGDFAKIKTGLLEMKHPVLINSLNFSEIFEKRLNLSSQFSYSGVLTVKAPVTVNDSVITKFVNGRELRSLLENIVFKNKPSVIEGQVVFTNITAYGPIMSKNSKGANGISVKEINANAVHVDSDSVLTDDSQWEHVVLESGAVGIGLFKGYNIGELYKEAVFLDVPSQVITGNKTFVNNIRMQGNIEAQTINGIDLRKRLFSRNREQNITGQYGFSSFIAEKNVNIFGKVNSVDMKFANSDKFKDTDITFRGNLTFLNNITSKHLKIGSFLDDIHVENRLNNAVKQNNTNIEITGSKRFTQNPEMPNANVKYLNGINFTDYVKHVLTLNVPKNLTRTMTVNGALTMPDVLTNALVVEGTVDGIDMKKLKREVLYLNEGRNVNATIEIIGNVHVNGNMNTSILNGHNIETEYLTMDTVQNILHDVTFTNIWTSDVTVEGLVNSWNLSREVEDTLRTSGGQIITGMKNFTSPVKVLGNIILRGKVGSDRKVKLSSQAIRLEEEEIEIEGLLIFNETVKVKRLSSSTNVINGVNYTQLCEKAWILDQPARITGKMIFEADVYFLRGLFYNTSDGKPSVGDLHKESLSLSKEISEKTFDFNKQYSNVCDSIVSMNRKLKNAIYDGDYFDIVGVENNIHRRSSSSSFKVLNTTYVAISWESEHCHSTLYKFNPETYSLVELKTLPDSGYGKQWLFIENGRNAYLALANSRKNNPCPRANSTIWKLNDNTIAVHQHLKPGERMAVTYSVLGGMKIFLHSVDHTTTYKLNPTTQLFETYKRTTDVIDISLSLHLQDKTSILFQAHKGYGKVVIKGKSGSREELARNILDAVLFEQNRKVFIAISSVTFIRQRPEHEIKLFSVDILTKSFRWLDHSDLPSPANLTSFYAGNQATGTTFIIAAQNNRFPVVYTLLGEKLRLFTELDIARVEWVQYIGVPWQRYRAFPDHYILFGQKDNTQVLTQLIMKGASAPTGNITEPDCNIQYLTNEQIY